MLKFTYADQSRCIVIGMIVSMQLGCTRHLIPVMLLAMQPLSSTGNRLHMLLPMATLYLDRKHNSSAIVWYMAHQFTFMYIVLAFRNSLLNVGLFDNTYFCSVPSCRV